MQDTVDTQDPPQDATTSPTWDRSQGLRLGRHVFLRSSQDRVVAGVAGGLGEMTGVDPVVVRIVFVILALGGGAGVLAYVALWLLAPVRAPGSAAPRRRAPATTDWRTVAGIVVAGVAVLVVLPFSGDGELLAGLVLLGVAALLWSSGREPVEAASPPAAAVPVDPAAPPAPAVPTAPAVAVAPAVARPRSVLGRVTFAVALLVAGAAAVADELGWVATDVGEVASLVLVVLGAGILVGAWWGRARWVALVALPVLPVAVLGQALSGLDLDLSASAVDAVFAPATPLDLPPDGYRHAGGSLVLDLRGLEEGPAGPVEVRLGGGEVVVLLPADAAGDLDVRVGAGVITLPDREVAGFRPEVEAEPYGDDRARIEVDLDIRVGAGEVRIEQEPRP